MVLIVRACLACSQICCDPCGCLFIVRIYLGYAQIALAHVARFFNKQATVFLATRNDEQLFPLTVRAKELGANVRLEPIGTKVTQLEAAAKRYAGVSCCGKRIQRLV